MKQGFGRLASIADALHILAQNVRKMPSERLTLESAIGRVLSEDIVARIDVPHFRRSAMDGFAVRASDTFNASYSNPKTLTILESVTAGVPPSKDVDNGSCLQVTTGSALPESADAVVMVEHVELVEGKIAVVKPCAPGENVIRIGSDMKKGVTALKKGTVLNSRYLGVCSAIGIKHLNVSCQPKVAYFSTGNEILPLAEKLTIGKVYDINSITVVETLKQHCRVIPMGIVADDLEAIKASIRRGIEASDVLILSGGSSLGAEDLMINAVESLGQVLIHGVAAKPGKPVLIGLVSGKIILGLPGYPASALSNTYVLALPLIYQMQGSEYCPVSTNAVLGRKIASTIGRYEFLPVKLEVSEGVKQAMPVVKGSSAISTMALADGYICIDENTEVLEQGSNVEVKLF